MGNDKTYVYGASNGAEYEEVVVSEDQTTAGVYEVSKEIKKRTHWDPRIEVLPYPGHGQVQIGIVPPTPYRDRGLDTPADSVEFDGSADQIMEWFSDNGQFMQLDRAGLNRLIEALQEAGAATFGRDRW